MKYLVIELQTYDDGTVGNIVDAFDDELAAESKWHLVLSSAAISALPMHAATLLRSDGALIKQGCYRHEPEPESEPEPEPEPEGGEE